MKYIDKIYLLESPIISIYQNLLNIYLSVVIFIYFFTKIFIIRQQLACTHF